MPPVSSVYKVNIPTAIKKQNDKKAGRDLIHRLSVASQSGRDVNLESILLYELSSVPRALSKTNGKLHMTDKAQLQAIVTQEIETPAKLPKGDSNTCLLIGGLALIQAIGKPERQKLLAIWVKSFVTVLLNVLVMSTHGLMSCSTNIMKVP